MVSIDIMSRIFYLDSRFGKCSLLEKATHRRLGVLIIVLTPRLLCTPHFRVYEHFPAKVHLTNVAPI